MEMIKYNCSCSRLSLLLGSHMSPGTAMVSEGVSAACFGLSQSLGKGVRPNFWDREWRSCEASCDGFGCSWEPWGVPLPAQEGVADGKASPRPQTCFWGTCTLQAFTSHIRGTFSWALQDHRHLWDSWSCGSVSFFPASVPLLGQPPTPKG